MFPSRFLSAESHHAASALVWHLVLFLFVTSSLADWTLDSPTGGARGPALQLRFDANPIVPSTTVTDDFSTTGADGVLNLAQVSQDNGNMREIANVVGTDPSTFESASSVLDVWICLHATRAVLHPLPSMHGWGSTPSIDFFNYISLFSKSRLDSPKP